MRSSDVVRIARHRAGLTQAELAARSTVPRETIARWEAGSREPSLSSLRSVVAAAGLDLTVGIAEGDDTLQELARDQLLLSPRDRLSALLPDRHAKAAVAGLLWLAGAASKTIVVGPLAAVLQGAPQRPGSEAIEVVASDSGLLADELTAGGFKAAEDAERWASTDRRWTWESRQAAIVIASGLPGSGGYPDLRRSVVRLPIGDTKIDIAHPRDLLRLAETSTRAAEAARVPGLRALLEVLE